MSYIVAKSENINFLDSRSRDIQIWGFNIHEVLREKKDVAAIRDVQSSMENKILIQSDKVKHYFLYIL